MYNPSIPKTRKQISNLSNHELQNSICNVSSLNIELTKEKDKLSKQISENLINNPFWKSKLLSFKVSLQDVKGKECSRDLKIIILKGLRENLKFLLSQITSNRSEIQKLNKLSFEESLVLSSQNYFDKSRTSFHKKNISNLPIDGRQKSHNRVSSFHTMASNISTTDGQVEEERFIEQLSQNISEEEERLVEIKKFRNNLTIELEDKKDDLCFYKKAIKEKQLAITSLNEKIESLKLLITNESKKSKSKKTKPPKKAPIPSIKNKSSKIYNTELDTMNSSRMNSSFMEDVGHSVGAFFGRITKRFAEKAEKKKNSVLAGLND